MLARYKSPFVSVPDVMNWIWFILTFLSLTKNGKPVSTKCIFISHWYSLFQSTFSIPVKSSSVYNPF